MSNLILRSAVSFLRSQLGAAAVAGMVLASTALPTGVQATADGILLRTSLYYSALETDYPVGTAAAFRSVEGRILARGSNEFLKAASIEGTAELRDGTVLNFDRLVGGEVRWKRVRARYGLDARGCGLVPFRSAAVDPKIVPLGSRLLIAATRGMRLPGGGRHDGIWIATDTGQGINGRRIDLFTGRGSATMKYVERMGIDYLDAVHVQILDSNLPCP